MLQSIFKKQFKYRASLIQSSLFKFSTESSIENNAFQAQQQKNQELLNKIISSHVAYKESLIQLLDTYHYFRNVEKESELRNMRELHSQHLTQLNKLIATYRVPPPIAPLTKLTFTVFGGVTSFLNQQNCDQFAANVSRIVENHTDYCLFQMNEKSLNEPELRKMIIQMRDSSYNISEKVISSFPEENSCVSNISDYIFQPILRQHFGGVE